MSITVLTQAKSHGCNRVLVTIGAIMMGLSLVYLAGFSHLELVHNAAHDTRHSSGFPCH
ncbi:CbtB-domain containing protein [Pseudomonas lutea]|uniref:CbtB-domain containing protein n=1 Tax=Pseudomonas lutea TaxID=243924 RepID=A0ABR9ABN6_9PSED|nr:CbtB domain-containing protein [Pseudomonas lutea]MBD8122913.1 CbtB-domain containing protein [Pseudomonas lutea]